MSFKEDMDRLQTIIDGFDTGDLDMEASLTLFEEGVGIVKKCREFLENAKRRVTVLSGEGMTGEPFEDEQD